MKNATQYVKPLNALLKRIHRKERPATPDPDPIVNLVMAFLEWDASHRSAESAYSRLMGALVDHNDLRVSRPHEIAAILGERYPRVQERSARLHDVLQAIFEREHAVSLAGLEKKAKKDIYKYLLSLPGMVPYVAARVFLLSFAGHAIPVDNVLVQCLKEAETVDPEATADEIAGFLEKHVKAEEAVNVHYDLRRWSDGGSKRTARRHKA